MHCFQTFLKKNYTLLPPSHQARYTPIDRLLLLIILTCIIYLAFSILVVIYEGELKLNK